MKSTLAAIALFAAAAFAQNFTLNTPLVLALEWSSFCPNRVSYQWQRRRVSASPAFLGWGLP